MKYFHSWCDYGPSTFLLDSDFPLWNIWQSKLNWHELSQKSPQLWVGFMICPTAWYVWKGSPLSWVNGDLWLEPSAEVRVVTIFYLKLIPLGFLLSLHNNLSCQLLTANLIFYRWLFSDKLWSKVPLPDEWFQVPYGLRNPGQVVPDEDQVLELAQVSYRVR